MMRSFRSLQRFLNTTNSCIKSSRYLILSQKSMSGKCLILHVSAEKAHPSQSLFRLEVQFFICYVATEAFQFVVLSADTVVTVHSFNIRQILQTIHEMKVKKK
jgi:hypothetical protein